MNVEKRIREAKEFSDRYIVTRGGKFRLKDVDPSDTAQMVDKAQAKEIIAEGVDRFKGLNEADLVKELG